MKQRWLLLSVSTAALLASCAGTPNNDRAASPVAPPETSASPVPAPQIFASPLVAASPTATVAVPATVPGLMQSTNAKLRVPVIVRGRQDPFAIVPFAPIPAVLSRSSQPVVPPRPLPIAARPPASPGPSVPVKAPSPVAVAPITSVPLPNLSGGTPLPPLTVPVAPPSPTALAEQIEVTGLVQLGGKWTVIVKEPSAATSRYVSAGDYLENGQVLVKRIVAPESSEPLVVLQQAGKEITKSLGGSTGPIASR